MNRAEAAALARKAQEKPIFERFWSKVDIRDKDECWPWLASKRNKTEDYGAFWYKGRHHPAPRIALYLKTGVLNTEKHTCHTCDNPECCNPEHLFVGTHLENNQDKVNKGRQARGEKIGTSKITEKTVLDVRLSAKTMSRKKNC